MMTTTTATTTEQSMMMAAVSASILALIRDGVDPIDALRVVCGDMVVNAMIDDLYSTLRAQSFGA